MTNPDTQLVSKIPSHDSLHGICKDILQWQRNYKPATANDLYQHLYHFNIDAESILKDIIPIGPYVPTEAQVLRALYTLLINENKVS